MKGIKMIGKHKTKIKKHNDEIIVKYHDTNVVTFNNNSIVLNTGGWTSNTTIKRMNETSNQFDLGFGVFQKNWEWFVEYNGKTYLMYEKTRINRISKTVYSPV